MAADYLLEEEGTSTLILEDVSGDLILESSTDAVISPTGNLVSLIGIFALPNGMDGRFQQTAATRTGTFQQTGPKIGQF